ncbi:MAG: hypothetical protein H0X24_17165 [Ktedonobacterales bacterium]|nr:hypothetical protein [Ktedonobacterales bacterium]
MAPATALNTPPAALPWYRVIPPFAWFTQPRQPKRLRPAGHSAWVEAMHQPVLFAISLAFTSAGLYTLAKDYVIKAFTAIGGGDYSQIIPVCLALFVIVITGGAIEIAFLTAASRLRMHLLRHEWGWTAVSAIMLLLTVGIEGLTCSYMFYLIEAPKLSPAWLEFMSNIPTLLFFVRAFAGLVCAAYLIIGVLPFVIRPDDVRREMAAEAGAAKVAIIQRLLHVVNELSVWQMLNIYEPVAAIFRDNAGYTSAQGANRLVLAAIGDVKQKFVNAGSWKPEYETLFAQVEKAHEANAGLELERYDEQTHAALTRLQQRLETAGEQQQGGIPTEQFTQLVGDLTALREQVAALPTTSTDPAPEMEYRFTALAEQLKAQFAAQLTALREQFMGRRDNGAASDGPEPGTPAFIDLIGEVSRFLTQQGQEGTVAAIVDEVERRGYGRYDDIAVAGALVQLGDRLREKATTANNVGSGTPPNPAKPKPGTLQYPNYVHREALRLATSPTFTVTFYNVAEALGETIEDVKTALFAKQRERLGRLRPGKALKADVVLDRLDFSDMMVATTQS